jgi:hypothetical protein
MFDIPQEDLTDAILKSPRPLGMNAAKINYNVEYMMASFLEQ